MHNRLGHLRELLGAEWQFDCLDAPQQISKPDRAWWINPPGERSYTASAYEGDEVAITQVEAAWASGNYDALLGFSQGAMLAAVVSARGLVGQGVVLPRCIVLLGSALPKPYEQLLKEASLVGAQSIASLHCLSKSDTINPPELGEWVADCFAPGANTLWHEGGHIIPGDGGERDKETVAAIATFLEGSVSY